jgi:hypothetical protein
MGQSSARPSLGGAQGMVWCPSYPLGRNRCDQVVAAGPDAELDSQPDLLIITCMGVTGVSQPRRTSHTITLPSPAASQRLAAPAQGEEPANQA